MTLEALLALQPRAAADDEAGDAHDASATPPALGVDVLVVDAEGADCAILNAMPLGRVRPRLLVFELSHPGACAGGVQRVIERLSDEGGYEFVWLEQEHGSGDWPANDAVVVRARGGSRPTIAFWMLLME